jgi:hypothetical protein
LYPVQNIQNDYANKNRCKHRQSKSFNPNRHDASTPFFNNSKS